MRAGNAIPWILIACLASVLLLGIWIVERASPGRPARPAAAPTATPPPSAVPSTAAPRSRTPPAGHRLAGTVVGDVRYAIVEAPDGSSDLYRPGQDVPGLGRLLEVDANRATFESEEGRIEISLAPAPTATVAPPSATPAREEPTRPRYEPYRGPTPSEEPPSDAPDRSAS